MFGTRKKKCTCYWAFHPSHHLKANKHLFLMRKIKNKSVGMVLKVDSVSERCSQRPSSRHLLTKHSDGPSFIFPTAEPPLVLSLFRHAPPLLQEGIKLSLDAVEWVFTHVVHLARFPALFPLLLGGDLRWRRSCGGCGLLHWVLVKLILRDRVSEWEYGTGRALYKVWVSPSQPYRTLSVGTVQSTDKTLFTLAAVKGWDQFYRVNVL